MINVRKNYFINAYLFFILISSINCSHNDKNVIQDEVSDVKIYKSAQYYLKKNNYEKAAFEFDKLFLNYPFSSLAARSEIMTAYSLFENNEIKRAIEKLEEFIDMNPSGELSEYAQYLLAMSYYIQVSNEGRDSTLSHKALKYFKIITTKYPNTAVIPETLYRLCEAFLMIGLKQEAIKSSSLLSYNFPKNEWTKLSKEILDDSEKLESNKGLLSSITNYMKKMID